MKAERRMKNALRVLTVMTASVLAVGAEDSLRGPVSGLLVDAESGTIRPILGSAGSAYAGAPAVQNAQYAVAAADGQQALVAREGHLSLLRRLGAGAPVWLTLREEASDLGLSSFSRNGGAVALHDTAHNRIEIWKSLGETPEAAGEIDLNAVPGRLVGLAVDDAGAGVFATFQENDTVAALYSLQTGAAPRLLLTMERAGVMALEGGALFVADRGRNEVHRLTHLEGVPQVSLIANEGHGLLDPVGVAQGADGRTVFVASAGTQQVLKLDAEEQALKAALDLSFVPTGLERSGSVLLLAAGVPGVQPAQVLDPVRFEVFFVPVSALPASIDSGASSH
jgi:hypothetical protein